jgi:chromosome partitioning protein
MKTYAVINMKGGVGKTISAINIAHILSAKYGNDVLLIDCDKQGNASKFFGAYTYEQPSISTLLTERSAAAMDVIKQTACRALDLIPANMTLLTACKTVLLDTARPQQTRLAKALQGVQELYDYCIIDCAPDINMATINALVASDAVLVPLSVDKFAFDGLAELRDQIDDLTEFNPRLHIAGAFATMVRRDGVNGGGVQWLRRYAPIPVFETVIHARVAVAETTFAGIPLLQYAPKNQATLDYVKLIGEIMERGNVIETVTKREV